MGRSVLTREPNRIVATKPGGYSVTSPPDGVNLPVAAMAVPLTGFPIQLPSRFITRRDVVTRFDDTTTGTGWWVTFVQPYYSCVCVAFCVCGFLVLFRLLSSRCDGPWATGDVVLVCWLIRYVTLHSDILVVVCCVDCYFVFYCVVEG